MAKSFGTVMKKAPPCQILIPAPWQKNRSRSESSDVDSKEDITEEISVGELVALIWSEEESKTPVSEVSEVLAAKEKDDISS